MRKIQSLLISFSIYGDRKGCWHDQHLSKIKADVMYGEDMFEPVLWKTNSLGFGLGLTQTRLYSHRIELEA